MPHPACLLAPAPSKPFLLGRPALQASAMLRSACCACHWREHHAPNRTRESRCQPHRGPIARMLGSQELALLAAGIHASDTLCHCCWNCVHSAHMLNGRCCGACALACPLKLHACPHLDESHDIRQPLCRSAGQQLRRPTGRTPNRNRSLLASEGPCPGLREHLGLQFSLIPIT